MYFCTPIAPQRLVHGTGPCHPRLKLTQGLTNVAAGWAEVTDMTLRLGALLLSHLRLVLGHPEGRVPILYTARGSVAEPEPEPEPYEGK
jgi:hypothetical protein